MSRALIRTLGITLASLLASSAVSGRDLRDLYFGEAIYHAQQGRYFEALERLDAELGQYRGLDEPQRDSLHYHIGQAEFSVGDFELYYRMHHRAGRAISAVLEGAVDEAVRNEAAFRLARIHFQKGQARDALLALERINGKVPEAIKNDVEFLRANVYLALGRASDAAAVLARLQGAEGLSGFAAYNLGIALLQDGRDKDALQQLDKAGQLNAGDPGALAIRDKSNMLLGKLMLERADFSNAHRSFDRVRLAGPYSNQALLSAGWANASAEDFERALAPWGLLAERDVTDAAVQEAMLALPYAYSKLNVHGRAAILYGRALESFGAELQKVDASIKSIHEGRFLKALVREEVRQDKRWVIRLRTLPDAPETFYLSDLMASHDFQTALQNYLDLDELHTKLIAWRSSFDAFEDLIRLRRQNYEPLLPSIDAQFRELDSQIRLRMEQRNHLEARLQAMLVAPRPDLLADADERIVLERMRAIEAALAGVDGPQKAELERRLQRLSGLLLWRLHTSYPQRLTDAHTHLRALNDDIAVLKQQYTSFVRARQAAMHSYEGYDDGISRLRSRVSQAQQQVNMLMRRQGRLIEDVAVAELKARRERLELYQTQARYAVADSYDRATKAQASGGRR